MNWEQREFYRACWPEPGEWWHEMYCPVCLVVAVDEETVTITKKYEDYDNGWKWSDPPTDLETISRSEFVKFLMYKEQPSLGFWAHCVRGEMPPVIPMEESEWEKIISFFRLTTYPDVVQ